MKWYENRAIDVTPIISSRIRLARNLSDYAFPLLINSADAEKMMNSAANAVFNSPSLFDKKFHFMRLKDVDNLDKQMLLEKHAISYEMLKNEKKGGLIAEECDSVNIMLNEEDHIRIQSVAPSDNMEEAWRQANILDDAFDKCLEYAFKKQIGYLTSCPTNTGTGLRASFMVHCPMLEKSGHLKNILPEISKFGITARGIYGEGSEPMGGIYQISNQLTLGKSESEIIEALKNVTVQIIDNENLLLDKSIKRSKLAFEDSIYRSYGILGSCRKISAREAMTLLSNVRLGYQTGLLTSKRPKSTIYKIMIGIQPGFLSKPHGKWLTESEREIERANYLRTEFAN